MNKDVELSSKLKVLSEQTAQDKAPIKEETQNKLVNKARPQLAEAVIYNTQTQQVIL